MVDLRNGSPAGPIQKALWGHWWAMQPGQHPSDQLQRSDNSPIRCTEQGGPTVHVAEVKGLLQDLIGKVSAAPGPSPCQQRSADLR